MTYIVPQIVCFLLCNIIIDGIVEKNAIAKHKKTQKKER